MKDLRVIKNVKEIKFEGVWGELDQKIVSIEKTHKISETSSSFDVK